MCGHLGEVSFVLVQPQSICCVSCAEKLISFYHFLTVVSEPGNILCKLMQCKLYGPYGWKLHSFLIHSTARNKRNAVLLFRDELSSKTTCGARKSVST